jgi:hypothetical protein
VLYIVGIVVGVLLVFFVAIPLIKAMFQGLATLLGNLIAAAIGIALLVGAIALCIAFPPLLIPVGVFVVYSIAKGRNATNETPVQ